MNPLAVDRLLRAALDEDLGAGDITSELALPPGRRARGTFVAKAAGVLCGCDLAQRTVGLLDPGLQASAWLADGTPVVAGSVLGCIDCAAAALLGAERVALNLLQRLSGIATLTARCAARAQPLGIRICETRKTTPGLRLLEKYAVRVGGGYNHRQRLDDAVLLKDNHFALSGLAPGELVHQARARASHALRIIAEADTLAMLDLLAQAGADVVLLDNFAPDEVRAAVELTRSPRMAEARLQLGLGRVLLEASGGITEATLDAYLIDGVDIISIGALTHSAPALDISLEAEAA